MRRLISALLSGLLAIAGLIALAPGASAHHTYVTASSVDCVPGTSDYKITWRVQNWNGGSYNTATITGSSRGVVPAGTTLANNQAKTFTEVVSSPGTYSLTVSARWVNGATHTQSGSVGQAAFPDCSTPVTPPAPTASEPTCEKDGKLVIPSHEGVTYEQSPSGTGPGTYTVTAKAKPGYKLSGTTQWTITVKPKKTSDDCLTAVTPPAPTASAPTCEKDGKLVISNHDGVEYSQSPSGSGPGTYTITATPKPGYKLIGTTQWTVTVESKKTGYECYTQVTPVAPHITKITQCDQYGSIEFDDTEGVEYEIVEGDGQQGTYKVKATAKDGYRIAYGATTEWTGDLGEYTDCATPVEPAVTAIGQCGEYGSIEFDDTEGVKYELVDGDGETGAYTVVATLESGYSFPDGTVTEWTGDLGEYTDCVEPEAPVATPIVECGEDGELVIPETEGIVYELVEGDGESGSYTVVATPAEGYGFEPGTVTEWTGDLGEVRECQQAVSFTPPHGTSTVGAESTHVGPASSVASGDHLPKTGAPATTVLWMLALMLLVVGAVLTVGAMLAAPASAANRGSAGRRRADGREHTL